MSCNKAASLVSWICFFISTLQLIESIKSIMDVELILLLEFKIIWVEASPAMCWHPKSVQILNERPLEKP